MGSGLEGKAALVTGASRGIGYAIAEELLACGARVCITARKPGDLEEALGQLDADERVFAVAGNSHDGAHRADAVAQVVDRFGSIDLLVNNAGTNPHYGPLLDADDSVIAKIMEVNVTAPIGWVREAWNAGMSDRGGAVLNIASIGGVRVGPMIGAYNVSKAALIHVTKQLALELGPAVRVNALAPAVVKTRFARALYEDREDDVSETYPLKRIGSTEDIAPVARFLLSEEASWITGETVLIDGGLALAGNVG